VCNLHIQSVPTVITTEDLHTNKEYIPILDILSLQNEQVKGMWYC